MKQFYVSIEKLVLRTKISEIYKQNILSNLLHYLKNWQKINKKYYAEPHFLVEYQTSASLESISIGFKTKIQTSLTRAQKT